MSTIQSASRPSRPSASQGHASSGPASASPGRANASHASASPGRAATGHANAAAGRASTPTATAEANRTRPGAAPQADAPGQSASPARDRVELSQEDRDQDGGSVPDFGGAWNREDKEAPEQLGRGPAPATETARPEGSPSAAPEGEEEAQPTPAGAPAPGAEKDDPAAPAPADTQEAPGAAPAPETGETPAQEPPQAAPAAEEPAAQPPAAAGPVGPIPSNDLVGQHGGQCVVFVQNQVGTYFPVYAAKEMLDDGKHPGYQVSSEPKPGSIFVQKGGQYGHTGIVQSVNDDGTVTVIDSNWNLDEVVQVHNIPIGQIDGYLEKQKAAA